MFPMATTLCMFGSNSKKEYGESIPYNQKMKRLKITSFVTDTTKNEL